MVTDVFSGGWMGEAITSRAQSSHRVSSTHSGCKACRAVSKGQYDCIKQFSETNFTGDLRKMTVPTLILHGDADQIVPIADTAKLAVKIAPRATLKVYPGAPHGMCTTHAGKVNADLLAFLKA